MIRFWSALVACLILASPAAAEDLRRSIQWQGAERYYLIHLPERRSTGQILPAVIALHGVAQTPEQFATITQFDPIADKASIAVIYPEGSGRDRTRLGWNSGFCCMGRGSEGIDDVGFVEAVRADAIAHDNLDPKRIYLTGFSNGAMLAYRIAAEHAEDYAAVVAASGSISGTGRNGKPVYRIPDPHRPITVGIIHSLTDPYMLYDGGVSEDLVQGMKLQGRINGSVAEALTFWRDHDGCESSSPAYSDTDMAVNLSYRCRDHTDVVLWTLKSAGHVWPAMLPKFEIQQGQPTMTTMVPSAEALMAFFLAHSR